MEDAAVEGEVAGEVVDITAVVDMPHRGKSGDGRAIWRTQPRSRPRMEICGTLEEPQ